MTTVPEILKSCTICNINPNYAKIQDAVVHCIDDGVQVNYTWWTILYNILE